MATKKKSEVVAEDRKVAKSKHKVAVEKKSEVVAEGKKASKSKQSVTAEKKITTDEKSPVKNKVARSKQKVAVEKKKSSNENTGKEVTEKEKSVVVLENIAEKEVITPREIEENEQVEDITKKTGWSIYKIISEINKIAIAMFKLLIGTFFIILFYIFCGFSSFNELLYGLFVIGGVISTVLLLIWGPCSVVLLTILTVRNHLLHVEIVDDYYIKAHKTSSKLWCFMLLFSLFLAFLGSTVNYAAKPIIYLYPEQDTNVSVSVKYPEKFTHTYPHYTDGWKVFAKTNGDLTDLNTGRHLYALYWEGKKTKSNYDLSEGFVFEGKDTIAFLEDKLDRLGLSEREAEEFIVYWLPKLEANKYNFVRFESIEEQNEEMPLMVEPKPDTIIRVMMEYKPLNKQIEVKEQVLPEKPQRNGFTLVEWGGTEI